MADCQHENLHWDKAIFTLLKYKTYTAAAAALEVNRVTLWRYTLLPEFRRRWFQAQASVFSETALAPFFWLVTNHIARNQTERGFRVSWNTVPAVTDVWQLHPEHWNKVARTAHALSHPQRGHRNPSGHRKGKRYSRQPSSVILR